jgi:conjugative transfer region lipoprotein (TIGR03751 family)
MELQTAQRKPTVPGSIDMARTPLLIAVAVCAALTGCASGSKQSTLPSDGPTMADTYRAHMTEAGRAASGPESPCLRPIEGAANAALTPYMRSVSDEIDHRFTRLPNPDLVMYVTPHLAGNGRYPVPGYSTVFPMYETVEYAMPGEAPVRRPPRPCDGDRCAPAPVERASGTSGGR